MNTDQNLLEVLVCMLVVLLALMGSLLEIPISLLSSLPENHRNSILQLRIAQVGFSIIALMGLLTLFGVLPLR
jgi:multidrug efflux pump subunit AcrB